MKNWKTVEEAEDKVSMAVVEMMTVSTFKKHEKAYKKALPGLTEQGFFTFSVSTLR